MTEPTVTPEPEPTPAPAFRPDPVRPAGWRYDDGPWSFPDLCERTYGRERRRWDDDYYRRWEDDY